MRNQGVQVAGYRTLFMDAYLGLKLKKRKGEIITITVSKFLYSHLLIQFLNGRNPVYYDNDEDTQSALLWSGVARGAGIQPRTPAGKGIIEQRDGGLSRIWSEAELKVGVAGNEQEIGLGRG